jgi:muramoyltetrapeptide carboxypeptidase
MTLDPSTSPGQFPTATAPLRSLRRPPALRPGDRVAVLSISSPADQVRLPVGLDALRFAGLEPIVYPSALDLGTMRPYLAGTDEMRAGDLRAALVDPNIAGIIFACGGSGAQRTLAALDWSGLDRVEPKVLAGYSDVTAVLEAVAVRLGWSSLFGQMVCGEDLYAFSSLMRCLMHPERVERFDYREARTIVPGTARGVTMGGNLSLLVSSIGTDTSWPARGAIVLVEDESEDDYRLDRMFTQLRRSGYFDGVAGVVAGTFYNCGEPAVVEPVLAERLGSLGVPMIAWANVGHGGYFQTFPIGVAAELDADRRTLQLLDPPLIPAGTP